MHVFTPTIIIGITGIVLDVSKIVCRVVFA